jgi:hypothetical protein
VVIDWDWHAGHDEGAAVAGSGVLEPAAAALKLDGKSAMESPTGFGEGLAEAAEGSRKQEPAVYRAADVRRLVGEGV